MPTTTIATVRAAPRLSRAFFDRDATTVARELLGKLLVRREGRQLLAGRLVEVEAYLGTADPASHGYRGSTPRNAVLFGPPGRAYVYFIYGNHYCTNVSCMVEGSGEGVLLRALEPVVGVAAMAANRDLDLPGSPTDAQIRNIASGPGRLSEALRITRPRDNDKDYTSPRSDLWFADDGYHVAKIIATPRIGINATNKAVHEPLRFIVGGNPFVSGPRKY
jgi:DNA-3-methyladenine glycosylase